MGFLVCGCTWKWWNHVYRKSASKYRVCQKIVHFLFFNVDSTESPDGLQSVLSSAAFPGRLLSLELLSELHRAPLYTQCRLLREIRTELQVFFFLVLSFLTYQNIAGRCVDSVSFQAGERCSGRGVTRRCGARVRFPIERSMTRQKTDRRYCSTSRATGISGAAWPAGAAFQSVFNGRCSCETPLAWTGLPTVARRSRRRLLAGPRFWLKLMQLYATMGWTPNFCPLIITHFCLQKPLKISFWYLKKSKAQALLWPISKQRTFLL